MARKSINADGVKLDSRISLAVTSELAEKITVLAEITFGGSVNQLAISLFEQAVNNNAEIIKSALVARKSYATAINNLKSRASLELAQDVSGNSEKSKTDKIVEKKIPVKKTPKKTPKTKTPPADETPTSDGDKD